MNKINLNFWGEGKLLILETVYSRFSAVRVSIVQLRVKVKFQRLRSRRLGMSLISHCMCFSRGPSQRPYSNYANEAYLRSRLHGAISSLMRMLRWLPGVWRCTLWGQESPEMLHSRELNSVDSDANVCLPEQSTNFLDWRNAHHFIFQNCTPSNNKVNSFQRLTFL